MKKFFLSFILVLFFTLPIFAQSVDTLWVRRYNGTGNAGDQAQAIAVDDSGYVYVTGESWDGTTARDFATVKYDQYGNQIWVKRYNGPVNGDDYPTAIAVDDSFRAYVTGYSLGSGSSNDFLTIRYKPTGDTAWVRRYNGPENGTDIARALAVDGSGNVYVTGESYRSSTYYDYTTIKYLPTGDTAWVRRYNGPGNLADYAHALVVDGSGNVYVTGESFGSGTDADYATIKYLPNGDTAWVRRYNRPGNEGDYAYALAVDDSGNVYVTGCTYASGSSWQDYATIKYLPSGDTAWVRRYNGPGNSDDVARAVAIDGSGNVYVTGFSTGSGTSYDYATIKYRPNGDTAWVRRYDGPGNGWDEARAIAVGYGGNVYVTGMSVGSGSSYDYATVKYDSSGNQVWVKRYNGPGNYMDGANAIAYRYPSLYVTGGSDGSGTNMDFATINYVQYRCGDANGDDKVTVADMVYLFNYCFKNWQPPPIFKGSGDVDGYYYTTIRDIAYLLRYLFQGGAAPNCERVGEYVPSGEPADTISSSPAVLQANVDAVSVDLIYKNSGPILGLAYPIKVTIGDSIPHIDTAATMGSRMSIFELQAATVDTSQGTVNIGFLDVGAGLPAGSGTMITLKLSIPPEPFDRQIKIDTLRLSPYNSPLFIKATTLDGIIPGYVPEQRNDTVSYIAYSPVDVIVTDPYGDSIGINFNTILKGSSYDTTQDVNLDGDKDDLVKIPTPLVGTYTVRVITEPGGAGNYSLGVKLDGNEERPLVSSAPVPPPGEADTFSYQVPEFLKGDANTDGKKSVSDVIFLINYLFKSGLPPNCPPSPYLSCTDVNCDEKISVSDVVFLINYLFKGGDPPCS